MSAFQVLESFYRDILAAYPPQGEKMLRHIPAESFRNLSFRYILSTEAMIEISQIIEDAVAQSRRTADLHVSFQYLSRFLPQLKRYRALAEGIAQGWIYGAPDIPDPSALPWPPRMRWINIGEGPLVNYWFVIAYGPGLSMSLVAREIPGVFHKARYYEGFYTFEQGVAYQLILIFHMLFPNEIPLPIHPEMMKW